MLLDTMCNTFGGIILIALLIALLARDTKVSEADHRRLTESSGLLQRQIEQAEQELTRAKTFQSDMEQRVSDPAQTDLLKLIEQRAQLRSASEMLAELLRSADQSINGGTAASQLQMTERIQQMNAENVAAERELIEQRNLGASLLGRIQELKRGMQQESNRLAQITTRQVQRLRLPREHQTSKTHLYVIVRYGQAYPLYIFRQGEPERNTAALRWEQENENTKRIVPVPGRGLNPETSGAALSQFLRDLPADKVYLVFQVFADSFAAFNACKQAAVQQGLEYTWEPRPNDAVLRLGATGLPPPPQ
jgi:hypothetical protein